MAEPGGILGEIVEAKRAELAQRLDGVSIDALRERAEPTKRSLRVLARPGARFILEIKKASPSAGAIRADADAVALARGYSGVADALSVLTDDRFFRGSLGDLTKARAEFDGPILAKDFFIDPRQVVEARIAGADAVLVMLSVVDDARAREMIAEARRFSMDALVEVHDAVEMRRALALGCPLIGINNRDLHDLSIDLSTTENMGGVQMGDQVKTLEKGVDVLIATPGRLMDLFSRGKIMLNDCKLLVIDEADRMLDMGFIPDIEEICSKLPKSRQTLLFSATMPPPIQKLAAKFLNEPKRVEVARPATANINIDQKLVEVSADKKKDALKDLLRSDDVKNAIVFCNRKTTVRELTTSLKRSHFHAGQIQGDMDQAQRIAEFDRFKRDEINILVASDVAARGLDVKGVSHVFNFDVPWQPDDYVHRIGRTGRAGAKGTAITLATRADAELIERIEKLTGTKIPRMAVSGKPAKADAKAPKSEPKPAKAAAEKPKKVPERSPVVEDISSDWNGPLPAFLSVSAD